MDILWPFAVALFALSVLAAVAGLGLYWPMLGGGALALCVAHEFRGTR